MGRGRDFNDVQCIHIVYLLGWLTRYYTVLFDDINGSAQHLIFPTIWSPPLATCRLSYISCVVVYSGRRCSLVEGPFFLCASVWCGTFFVCLAHKKWKTMTYLQIWYVRKTKKNVWTGPVFTGKTRKTKKMCEICFYVHVLRALGTPLSREHNRLQQAMIC